MKYLLFGHIDYEHTDMLGMFDAPEEIMPWLLEERKKGNGYYDMYFYQKWDTVTNKQVGEDVTVDKNELWAKENRA